MKNLIWFFLLLFSLNKTFSQSAVNDPQHFATVNENDGARELAETTHRKFLDSINSSLNNININVSSVVLAQTLIYQGLSNVNSALKNGLALKNLSVLVIDITKYSDAMLVLAQTDPALLLFSESYIKEIKTRALSLLTETSGFILNDTNILMDFEKRDKLMNDITRQLQIINSLTYGAWRAMYWANVKGIFKALNPWQGFIDQDKAMVSSIISHTKYLRQ